ncbi:hypothetical protein [Streptomyces eurythermus]
MYRRIARLFTVLAVLAALVPAAGAAATRAEAASRAQAASRAEAADGWNPPTALDQIMADKGSVNHCVRWESDAPVSAALRDRIHAGAEEAVRQVDGGHAGRRHGAPRLAVHQRAGQHRRLGGQEPRDAPGSE